MKRNGGSIFENVIARRIVILAKLGNEFNQLKLEKKRSYIFWERIRQWRAILVYTGMSVALMIIGSLLPFVVGGILVLLMATMTLPLSTCLIRSTTQQCNQIFIEYIDDISSAIYRMICSLSVNITNNDLQGFHWRYWKWVCYILVGNTCNQN